MTQYKQTLDSGANNVGAALFDSAAIAVTMPDGTTPAILQGMGIALVGNDDILGPVVTGFVGDQEILASDAITHTRLNTLIASTDLLNWDNFHINLATSRRLVLTDDTEQILIEPIQNGSTFYAVDIIGITIANTDAAAMVLDLRLDAIDVVTIIIPSMGTFTGTGPYMGTTAPDPGVTWNAQLRSAPTTGEVTIAVVGRQIQS